MRTLEEKQKEIEKLTRLRNVIPSRSAFETDNHLVIDLQIAAINGDIKENAIDEREYFEGEEGEDDSKDLSSEEANEVRIAFSWLNGDVEEVCSESDIENFSK